VARCAATFAFAVLDACEFGTPCAESSAGTTTAAATSKNLRSIAPSVEKKVAIKNGHLKDVRRGGGVTQRFKSW